MASFFAKPGSRATVCSKASSAIPPGVFTGRERAEARHTLKRFAPDLVFEPMICDEDVAEKKPHPEGLQRIAAMYPGEPLIYVGDTVDDARSARRAGVPFIGIAAAGSPRAEELRSLLSAEGAIAVIDNINEMEPVVNA